MDVPRNGSKIQAFPKKDIDIDVRDQINTIEALWAKACFCSGDKYVVNLLMQLTRVIAITIEMIMISALKFITSLISIYKQIKMMMTILTTRCNTDVPTWSDPDMTTTPAPGSAIHPTLSILLISLISVISILIRI